jgi:hypothetical protein
MKTYSVDLHSLHKKEIRRSHSLYEENSRFAETPTNSCSNAANQPRQRADTVCGKGFAQSR